MKNNKVICERMLRIKNQITLKYYSLRILFYLRRNVTYDCYFLINHAS